MAPEKTPARAVVYEVPDKEKEETKERRKSGDKDREKAGRTAGAISGKHAVGTASPREEKGDAPVRRGVSGKTKVVTTAAEEAEAAPHEAAGGRNGAPGHDEPSDSQKGHPAFADADSGDEDASGERSGLQRSKSGGILRTQSLYRPDPVTGLVPQKSGRRIVVVDPPAEDDDAPGGKSGRKGASSGGCCGCFG